MVQILERQSSSILLNKVNTLILKLELNLN